MNLHLIPVGYVAGVIPSLLPYLQESQEWSEGRSNVDDILRFVLNGQMQLWAVNEDAKIYGHVITEVKHYPQFKMLVVQYCCAAPHSMQYVDDEAFDIFERFAKDTGCVGVEFVGRPGWRKQAAKYGYELQSVTYQKFLKDTS